MEEIEVETFYDNGVVMVRYPDGTTARLADIYRQAYPGREFDDMTGVEMAVPPPRPDAPGEAAPRREYQFGDVGRQSFSRAVDNVSNIAGAGGEVTRSLLPEDWQQTFPDAVLAAGDYGLAGLTGLLGGVETATGFMGDAVEGLQRVTGLEGRYAPGGSARALQRDLMGMFEATGAGPEGRMLAAISGAARPGIARGVMDFVGDEAGALRLGAPDPAIQQAEEVLSLLRTGRADEVTDQMLDMGDPVLNARLNEYLFNNYDLPMDAASRAERQARYRGGLYSGTGEDFPAFNNAAIYATDNPDLAYTYSPSDGGNIMPLVMRAKHGAPVINAGGANWNRLTPSMREGGPQAPYIPGILRDPDEIAVHGEDILTTRDFEVAAKEQGFSGLTFNDIVDVGGYLSKYFPAGPQREAQIASIKRASQPSTVETRFYPNQVRSAFARFDPRLAHLRNLNASVAAALGLGGLLALPQEEQY